MKWFKHPINLIETAEFAQIIDKYGGDGYFAFFVLFEFCASQSEENCIKTDQIFKISASVLCRKVRWRLNKVESFLAFCHDLQLIKLFTDNEVITQESDLVTELLRAETQLKLSGKIFLVSFIGSNPLILLTSGLQRREEKNILKKNRIEKKETSIRFDSFLNDEQPKQPEAKQPEQPNNKKIREIKVPTGSDEFVTLLNRFKIMDYKIRSSEEIIKKHFFGLARFEEFLKSVSKRDQFKIIESKSKLHADNYLNKAIRLEVGL